LSFFDEADEPRTQQQTTPRRRRPSGTGRRPPSGPSGPGRRRPPDQQSIQVRRGVAAVAIIVVLILIILGVHSCQVSARNSALKDYTNNVSSLIQQSNQTGTQLFTELSGGGGQSNATNLQSQINDTLSGAVGELSHARGLSVPDQMQSAQQNLVLALQMRRDGIANIATQIQPALGSTTSNDALNSIATEMARFYASDVLYKDYTAPLMAAALHASGIAVGGLGGVTIEGGQFLPDLGWLTPSFVASKIGASVQNANGKPAPGLHGHVLNSVSVAGTTLQTGSTNTIPSHPPPTFTLNFTNGGHFNELDVVLKVTVNGTSTSGRTVVPQTTPGQTLNTQVTLTSSPPAGNYTVVATVQPVPGEANTANNTLSFPVTFQ
jgi:hypothetical protein